MSFKLFIYYSAVCGGWAAFCAWVLLVPTGLHQANGYVLALVMGGVLGMLVAAAVGYVDALLSSSGAQRAKRAFVCAGTGLLGGAIGALIGQALNAIGIPLFIGWMLVGIFIGSSVGIFDFMTARSKGQDTSIPFKKVRNGLIGGLVGGAIGGFLFGLLSSIRGLEIYTTLALGLVILGASIGLMIGLAQIFLKEHWLRIEIGKRAGRQIILANEELTIGRAESCEVGLFGEKNVERLHARLYMHKKQYVIEDAESGAGTFVNDIRITAPTLLSTGDLIRIGSAVLRYGERQKQGT